jgi:hypothetical protein
MSIPACIRPISRPIAPENREIDLVSITIYLPLNINFNLLYSMHLFIILLRESAELLCSQRHHSNTHDFNTVSTDKKPASSKMEEAGFACDQTGPKKIFSKKIVAEGHFPK